MDPDGPASSGENLGLVSPAIRPPTVRDMHPWGPLKRDIGCLGGTAALGGLLSSHCGDSDSTEDDLASAVGPHNGRCKWIGHIHAGCRNSSDVPHDVDLCLVSDRAALLQAIPAPVRIPPVAPQPGACMADARLMDQAESELQLLDQKPSSAVLKATSGFPQYEAERSRASSSQNWLKADLLHSSSKLPWPDLNRTTAYHPHHRFCRFWCSVRGPGLPSVQQCFLHRGQEFFQRLRSSPYAVSGMILRRCRESILDFPHRGKTVGPGLVGDPIGRGCVTVLSSNSTVAMRRAFACKVSSEALPSTTSPLVQVEVDI
ncbi:microtubule-associated protein 1B-like protein [Lates japonicus]|uniref:Microtubule-associated protein 1B-like protein n=1 Tax=Lates japonicus TaxID=270547 RepID=A0AAD3N8R1_LATJO|nr:microtubule-associated protein 1B-like protein [Lates japonicus]